MAEIKMPQLGESVTEGTITKWLKKVGETVKKDEPFFEVSTDKVDSEVPSTESGVVTQILVEEGDTVEVGTVLAVLGSDSMPNEPAPVVSTPPVQPAPEPAPVVSTPPVQPAPEPGREAAFLLSPVVRKLIRDNGISATEITGTGAGGRITRADVLGYLDRRSVQGYRAPVVSSPPVQPAPEPAPVVSTPPVQPVSMQTAAHQTSVVQQQSLSVGSRDEVVPFSNIRRRTAEHMVRSKAISAHTLVSIEVDFEGVERVRSSLREQFHKEEGFSLTYLPFVSRAALEALRTYPRLNASVGDDALIVHKDIHLAIAVDLDLDGLIAPVLHNAETKRLTGIAREIHDLAHRARTKQLSADDISGGTFTITNPGPFGTLITYPIINQPQVAILSTDGIRRKPVVVKLPDGSETIGIHSVGVLAIAFDHRVIDGAYAAAFLARMREIIETWNWAQEF